MTEKGHRAGDDQAPVIPAWVRALGFILVVLVVLLIVMLVLPGGHGPARHLPW